MTLKCCYNYNNEYWHWWYYNCNYCGKCLCKWDTCFIYNKTTVTFNSGNQTQNGSCYWNSKSLIHFIWSKQCKKIINQLIYNLKSFTEPFYLNSSFMKHLFILFFFSFSLLGFAQKDNSSNTALLLNYVQTRPVSDPNNLGYEAFRKDIRYFEVILKDGLYSYRKLPKSISSRPLKRDAKRELIHQWPLS